jgi:hypothetical protein
VTVYVFVGPTLPVDEARAVLEATYLPPVSQGDVYRAARAGARAIGIIDGYFERMPAVWHKEILWAMAEGVHVFGSSSMGALRAAELAPFGMTGVGDIFQAFASGALEDDDEVAVAHGPADTGFVAGSDAMVNIRATLNAARAEAVLGERTASTLERIAKNLFYPDRSYGTLLQHALRDGIADPDELNAFRAWLPIGRIDQKRRDALAMMRAMRDFLDSDPPPKRIRYTFERTVWWEQATITAGELHVDAAQTGAEAVLLEALLEEAQLDGQTYARAYDSALLRHLAVRYAAQANAAQSPEYQQHAADRFRRTHGLLRATDVDHWLDENRLDRDRFAELLREQAMLEWTSAELNSDVTRRLTDELRLTDRYAGLLQRARLKQHTLTSNGWDNPSLEDADVTREELLGWYFGRLDRAIPIDIEDFAHRSGFDDSEALVRAALREYFFVRTLEREVASGAPAPAV